MITIEETTDYELIKTIVTNPDLLRLSEGFDADSKTITIDNSWIYLLIKDDDNLVGCFRLKEMTKAMIEGHIHILPTYWGNELTKEAVVLGHKWIKEQGYLKVFTFVPANCIHVLKFLHKLDYKICGSIKNAIVYRNILVTLFLYEFEV